MKDQPAGAHLGLQRAGAASLEFVPGQFQTSSLSNSAPRRLIIGRLPQQLTHVGLDHAIANVAGKHLPYELFRKRNDL